MFPIAARRRPTRHRATHVVGQRTPFPVPPKRREKLTPRHEAYAVGLGLDRRH